MIVINILRCSYRKYTLELLHLNDSKGSTRKCFTKLILKSFKGSKTRENQIKLTSFSRSVTYSYRFKTFPFCCSSFYKKDVFAFDDTFVCVYVVSGKCSTIFSVCVLVFISAVQVRVYYYDITM